MEISNNKFSVLGIARSGAASANFLARRGGDVLISDIKEEKSVNQELLGILDKRIRVITGKNVVRKGDVCIISPGITPHSQTFIEAKSSASILISEVELFYLFCPAPIVAITGTDGKSTVSSWIHQILKSGGKTSHLGGNIGNPLCGFLEDVRENDVVVAEVSCFQLITTQKFKPKVSVITNIAEDHIDYHGSFEEYMKAKQLILKNQGKWDYFIKNTDDPHVSKWNAASRVCTIPVSVNKEIKGGVYVKDGSIFSEFDSEKPYKMLALDTFQYNQPHNVENSVISCAAAMAAGLPAQTVADSLPHLKGLEHRIEFVEEFSGVKFYNDSKGTNAHATIAALRSFQKAREKFVLIAGGFEKGLDYTELALEIPKTATHVVLIGASAKRIAETIRDSVAFEFAGNLEEAVEKSFKAALPEGTVLFSPACSSYDMFKNYEDRGRKFKDAVREFIKCKKI
jgi:UDP-N-acetylmuramoylalanine--D-glutamate ligase